MTEDPGEPVLEIHFLGGGAPVQGEGVVGAARAPWYFRARGAYWELRVGGSDPVLDPEWVYAEPWGEWPAASHMGLDEAEALIRAAARLWAAGGVPHRPEAGSERWNVREDEAARLLGVSPRVIEALTDWYLIAHRHSGTRWLRRSDVLRMPTDELAAIMLRIAGIEVPEGWAPIPD